MLSRKSKQKQKEKPKTGANQRHMQLNDCSNVYYVLVKLISDILFGYYTFLDILLQLN